MTQNKNDISQLYQPESNILIVTICSFTKKEAGESVYDKKFSIFKDIKNQTSLNLLSKRNEILSHLWNGDFDTQGQSVSEHEYNKGLTKGADFGGKESIGSYLPALARYDGRFYRALGKEGKTKVVKSKHHLLIQTGLYGLVKPLESIQLYSVPIEKDSLVQKIWKRGDVLTQVIIDYVKKNQISRIFDFTSRKDYRDVINWQKISHNTGAQIFYCFSLLAGGADSLIFYGEFLREYLLNASENELLQIEPDTEQDKILFRSIAQTFETSPKEDSTSDQIFEAPISDKWSWFIHFEPNFFRGLQNLGGVKEKSKVLRDLISIQSQPDLQIKDIQKPYSGNLKGKWRRRSLKSIRLVYSFNHERRTITIHELSHK